MNEFDKLLEEQLEDSEFKKEWDSLDSEFLLIESLLKARAECKMTQKELSKVTGITQADISKIESGKGNPSFKTLIRLAKGMGMTLRCEFVKATQ